MSAMLEPATTPQERIDVAIRVAALEARLGPLRRDELTIALDPPDQEEISTRLAALEARAGIRGGPHR